MSMSENIKKYRLEMGWTQEELGKKIGKQKSVIAKYESGDVENIKRSTILKMSELFHVAPSILMGFTEKQQSDYEEGYNEAMKYLKKYKVLQNIMLAGGALLEIDEKKDDEATLKLLEAYCNALEALKEKGSAK